METETKWCSDHQKQCLHAKLPIEDKDEWVCTECMDEYERHKSPVPDLH